MPRKAKKKTSMQGRMNLTHAIHDKCEDPDCEIHIPSNIEDQNAMFTAMAWYFVGAQAMARMIARHRTRPIDADVNNLKTAMVEFMGGVKRR